jgi:PIN domain nuclease of toxin-antitoxin system
MNVILDASALLAWLQNEPGAEVVETVLEDAAMSSLNWSEVLQKFLSRGVDITGLYDDLAALGLTILPFDINDAEQAAKLWAPGSGFSLADRACLALGIRHGVPVWTADRVWAQATTGASVQVIRS